MEFNLHRLFLNGSLSVGRLDSPMQDPALRLMQALTFAEMDENDFCEIARQNLNIDSPKDAQAVLKNIFAIVMDGTESEKEDIWGEELMLESYMKKPDYTETALDKLIILIEARSRYVPHGFTIGMN